MSQQRAHRDPAPLEEYPYPILTKASGHTTKMLAVGVFMVIASGYLIYRGIREGDYMLSITGGSEAELTVLDTWVNRQSRFAYPQKTRSCAGKQ